MFKKEYQGGSSVEVFSAQGRDPVQHWRLSGSVKKQYDKEIRGYVYVLEGGTSTTTTRMTLPKSEKALLSLLQPCCALQLFTPAAAKLAVDFSVVDSSGGRRRLHLSTSQRDVSATPLNARLPLVGLLPDQWMTVCVDVGLLVPSLFKGATFKSLEGISVGGSCRLRRIFTLKITPTDYNLMAIPQSYHISSVQLPTLIIDPSTISAGKEEEPRELPRPPSDSRPTRVAFGKKVPIPAHILSSQQSRREGRSKVRADDPVPPSTPASQSVLKVQRARVRIVSGKGSPSNQSAGRGSSHAQSGKESTNSSFGKRLAPQEDPQEQLVVVSTQNRERRRRRGPTRTSQVTDSQTDQGIDSVTGPRPLEEGSPKSMDINHQLLEERELHEDDDMEAEEKADIDQQVLSRDEQLALTVLGHRQLLLGGETHTHNGMARRDEEEEWEEQHDGEPEGEWQEEGHVYSYRSAPKSAEMARVPHERGGSSSSRGAKLEEDFVLPKELYKSSSPSNSPSHFDGVVPSGHIAPTRLSDDYDWRQYASKEDHGFTKDDLSLRTRLAGGQSHPPSSHTHNSIATAGLDDTLSESMTLSGVTEQFKTAAHSPFLDSMDTRGMGGMLSPALPDGATTLGAPGTAVNHSHGNNGGEEQADELELMYDPQLNCFYDPTTYKYYELIQP